MTTTIDDKTLTIKFFINNKLKPREWKNKQFYPLYVQVIFDQKNTRFKYIGDNNRDIWLEENHNIENIENDLFDYKKAILEIIKFELDKYKSGFRLNKLGKRVYHYFISLSSVFELLASLSIVDVIEKKYNDINLFLELENLTKNENNKRKIITRVSDFKDYWNKVSDEIGVILLVDSLFFKFYDKKENTQVTPFDWFIKNQKKDFIHLVKNELETLKNEGFFLIYEDKPINLDSGADAYTANNIIQIVERIILYVVEKGVKDIMKEDFMPLYVIPKK